MSCLSYKKLTIVGLQSSLCNQVPRVHLFVNYLFFSLLNQISSTKYVLFNWFIRNITLGIH